jgi:hypothetical protein
MSPEMIRLVAGVVFVALVGIIIMRRKRAGARRRPAA